MNIFKRAKKQRKSGIAIKKMTFCIIKRAKWRYFG